jgi:RNA polymerase sigma factor (sigma-70 family)
MRTQLIFFNEDSRYLDALRNGDENGLIELFNKNRRPIVTYILRNQGTEDDAEDVLQEALIVLWERVKHGTFEYQAKLSTFVYATAKNIWLRRLARNRREISSSSDSFDIATHDANPLEVLEENERIIAIQKAMEKLGNPCHDLLLLYYWEELSMEEIALKLGFANADTVKSKKYQCKKALEKLLRKVFGDDKKK